MQYFNYSQAPGKEFVGVAPPHGGPCPTYRANGVQFYLLSLSLSCLGLYFRPQFAVHIFEIFPQV